MLGDCSLIGLVATAHPERAEVFDRETLGLRLLANEPFALVFDAAGTILRVANVREMTPAPYTVLGWRVGDIRAAVESLGKRDVTFESFEQLLQDELGIWTSPGGGKVAWFKDPDGNTLSLTQFPAE